MAAGLFFFRLHLLYHFVHFAFFLAIWTPSTRWQVSVVGQRAHGSGHAWLHGFAAGDSAGGSPENEFAATGIFGLSVRET